jgi:hypothetical protein
MARIVETIEGHFRIATIEREGRIFPIYTTRIVDRKSGDEVYQRPVLSRALAREVATTWTDPYVSRLDLETEHTNIG